jgi:LAO/AO transport system kinase
LIEQARRGSIRAASRLISLLEDDPTHLAELFDRPEDWPAPRLVVGITGPPGVGKSRLIDGLIAAWRIHRPERRLGVIAVDPSSPYSGGAVLGDRVRMMDHAADDKVFIRSLGSRGHLGGLSLGTRAAVRIMGLAGCDVVLVETVGVGQGEVEVAGVADVVCVVLAPGLGDGVQMLKAGLMETADVFVINKADLPGADRLRAELDLALAGSPDSPEERPAVFQISAARREGMDELVRHIEHRAADRAAQPAARRFDSIRRDIRDAIRESARRLLEAELAAMTGDDNQDEMVDRVLNRRATVADIAGELIRRAADRADGRVVPSGRTSPGPCPTPPPLARDPRCPALDRAGAAGLSEADPPRNLS